MWPQQAQPSLHIKHLSATCVVMVVVSPGVYWCSDFKTLTSKYLLQLREKVHLRYYQPHSDSTTEKWGYEYEHLSAGRLCLFRRKERWYEWVNDWFRVFSYGALIDAMKMNCFFQLNKEKLQNQWDEAGLTSLYYIITVLVLFFIFLGLTILMETYKVDKSWTMWQTVDKTTV